MANEDYKKKTTEVYDSYAKTYEANKKDYFNRHLMGDRGLFLEHLSGKKILDLGSGPGRDSIFFKEHGYEPICLDISEEMIKLCKEKKLEAVVGDIEKLNFQNEIFDGIWAYTSLVHLPKNKIPAALSEINRVLKKNGIFYLGMIEGDFEGFKGSQVYEGEKFFLHIQDSEMRQFLIPQFEILDFSKVTAENGKTYLNYLTKKRC